MNWYLAALKKYATFEGRASRSEYWYFFLFNGLIQLVLVGLLLVIPVLSPVINIVLIIYAIAMMLPSLAVVVRRLHDIGKSGWWYLIVFIPLIGFIVLLVFAVLDSELGNNKYGINPKNTRQNNDRDSYPKDMGGYVPPQGIVNSTVNQGVENLYEYKLISENHQYPEIKILGGWGEEIILGRDGDIVIQNDYISGKHCMLGISNSSFPVELLEKNIYIKDLDSTNGTYIDGRKLNPLEEVFIREGQRIILGSEEVVYTLQQA